MNTYTRKIRTFSTTEWTTTYDTTVVVQVRENNRNGVIQHRYGEIIHAHYDKSLMGVMPRWVKEHTHYHEWRPGYPM